MIKKCFTAKYSIPAVMSIACAVLVYLLLHAHGTGVTPDSIAYMAAARNIAEGKGVLSFAGKPLVSHPPFYSVILAVPVLLFQVDPLVSTPMINSILLGVIIFLSGILLQEFFRQEIVLITLPLVAVMLARPIVHVIRYAWSEPLFITLTLVYFIFGAKYRTTHRRRELYFMGSAIALASLTRYIGISLLFAGLLNIWVFNKSELKKKFSHVSLFCITACLPVALWLTRNIILGGSPFGERYPSIINLGQNIGLVVRTILQWFLPLFIVKNSFAVFAMCVIFCGLLFYWGRKNLSSVKIFLPDHWTLISFLLSYIPFLIIISTITAHDTIGDRLLSPAFIPFYFLLIGMVWEMINSSRFGKEGKLKMTLMVIFLLATLVYPVRIAVFQINEYRQNEGLIYNTLAWRESKTIKYVLEHELLTPGTIAYCNDPHPLYLYTRINTALTPSKSAYNSSKPATDPQTLKGKWPGPDTYYLIWFNTGQGDFLFSLAELQSIAQINEVIRFSDGAIYTVSRK